MFKRSEKQAERTYCAAVVVAAGSGTRMGADKLFMQLGGCTVIERTLAALDESEWIDEIVVATQSEKITTIAALARGTRNTKAKMRSRGRRGQDSFCLGRGARVLGARGAYRNTRRGATPRH